MRLQHLSLFRRIGLGACALSLGNRLPSPGLARDPLERLRFDHPRVSVQVAAYFRLRFPKFALRQNRFPHFANPRKSGDA